MIRIDVEKTKNMEKQFFIIDFDSTVIAEEGLDALAAVALANHPEKEGILDQIRTLTKQGMEGKISFTESLAKRISLLTADKTHIEKTVRRLKKKITPSVIRNKTFFKKNNERIYIISGGFKEIVVPVAKILGIAETHVFANTFTFDRGEKITGIDTKNPLSRDKGKEKVMKSLSLDGEVIVIGDGITDLAAGKSLPQATFVAFTENVIREHVVAKADSVVKTFDELLYEKQLPRALSYPKSKMKVLLLENIDQTAAVLFEEEGYHVKTYAKSLSKPELLKAIADVHILGIRSRTKIDEEMLRHAKKLLAIGAFCIGTEQIDLLSCQIRGIAVFNAPYSNTRSVTELVIGEMLMLARGVIDKNNNLHQGIWNKSAQGSFELRGKTLGIVGYGHIGTQVSVLAESLGMHVLFYDVMEKLAFGNAKQCSTLKSLLQQADIVTLHVDGRATNRQLIGEKEFQFMKDGVMLINSSRGMVVDVDALVKYLKKGKVKGAALDVFPVEPKSKSEPFISSLQNLPNVILTPHIGSGTEEAQKHIAGFVSKKLLQYIDVGSTSLSVSLPEIELPINKSSHRLLHVHKNVPGVLAQINAIFANQHVNIGGQYLQTRGEIGYVITDVNQPNDRSVVSKLKEIPETIKVRVLY